jgi:hypothetical protein
MYELACDEQGLKLERRIEPIRFKNVNQSSREQDLEDLIVRHPGLLNLGDYSPQSDEPDLLIISRQPKTSTSKRADLFAVDREGNLVVIEIKRDAIDERNRKEAMEFQAIRYAAASRKLNAARVIQLFAKYLSACGSDSGTPQMSASAKVMDAEDYESSAEQLLRNHLEDEDETLSREDLETLIAPKLKQKIYLVAASYEPDVTSACAWLREHGIPIFCFQLRPYRIGDVEFLERHRLIPPPELDEYMLDMATPSQESLGGASDNRSTRSPSDKPTSITFVAETGETVGYSVNSWKAALIAGVKHLIEVEHLPVERLAVPNSATSHAMFRNAELIRDGLRIETNASASLICNWLENSIRSLTRKSVVVRIETRSGRLLEFPRAAE